MPGDEHDSRTAYGSLTPGEAYSLVGNEVRAKILRALSDARAGSGEPPVLSFSELRSRVDTDIDSSQFNYHLQQLVGHFVEQRVDGDAQLVDGIVEQRDGGYALRPEGTTLTRTIRAATATDRTSFGPVEVGLDCHYCGDAVEARYENMILMVQCPDCEFLYEYDLTPPGALDADERLTLSQFAEYLRHSRLAFSRGVCPLCANALGTEFVPGSETGYPRADRREVLVNRWCAHCGHRNYLKVGEALLGDPGLISFCHEHGLDVTTTSIWELEFAATDRFVTVRSTDPWEVALRVTVDEETLELVVDGDLTVIERTRS